MLQLSFVTSLPSIIILLPIFLVMELTPLRGRDPSALEWDALLVLTTAVLAFIYIQTIWFVVKYTSAHYGALVGNVRGPMSRLWSSVLSFCRRLLSRLLSQVKSVLLVGVSILIFNTVLEPINVFGIVLGIVGFVLYNLIRWRESHANTDARERTVDGVELALQASVELLRDFDDHEESRAQQSERNAGLT